MNVIMYSPWASHTPFLETELEIIEKHLEQGDEVTVLTCRGELESCFPNPGHGMLNCLSCRGLHRTAYAALSRPVQVRSLYLLTPADLDELRRVPTKFTTHDDLKRFRLGNFDIGYAALSSLVSLYRDPDIDFERHAALLKRTIRSAWTVHRSLQRYLQQHPVDRVYVQNGREAQVRGVLRACQEQHVDCIAFERAENLHHYALYENTLPHDRFYHDAKIREFWERAAGNPNREAIGARWFEQRANGDCSWTRRYTINFKDILPAGWDAGKRNIAIFPSSEDEFVAIGDSWSNPIYGRQLDGLRAIIDSLRADPSNLHLYIRVHPNLGNVNNYQTRALYELQAPFVTVIDSTHPVSTYTLMRHANKVLTFGSSTGIEAVYWGVPSVLAGRGFYCELGGTFNPETHDEVLQTLKADLRPKERTPALMYGFFFATHGERYHHYQPESIRKGTFKGRRIRPPRLMRTIEWMRSCRRSMQQWIVGRPASVMRKVRRLRRLRLVQEITSANSLGGTASESEEKQCRAPSMLRRSDETAHCFSADSEAVARPDA